MLDVLYGCLLEQGDEKTRELHAFLYREAAKPFTNMLQQWLFKGELIDPYNEFMIQENRRLAKEGLAQDFNSQYWEERYTLRTTHTPKILRGHGNSLAQMILTAGKYLSVVRGSFKGTIVLPEEQELRIEPDSLSMLTSAVTKVYTFSSRALLRLLEDQHGLSTHLKSLRRFFLLEHGDFFTQFMDTAEGELRREAKDISISRIHHLLQLAIQTSTVQTDPHRDDLSCSLASHNLIQHLHLIQSAGENNDPGSCLSIIVF
jgi:gamma-tubulin complex component 2